MGVPSGLTVVGDVPKVVIVGAGFGGLATARELAHAPVEITLVDRHNFHTFLPLLYQVATAGLNPADVAYPVRGIFQRQMNVEFRHAVVSGVDWPTKRLLLVGGDALSFDYLVVAAGSTTNFFGVPGASDHGFSLYSLAEAAQLRNHILERWEEADTDPERIDDGALNVVVVGGGPTGVEVAGALAELFSQVMTRDYHHLETWRARVILIERETFLLPPFHPDAQYYSRQTLISRGVEVRLGESVERVTATRVHLASGEVIPAHTLIWAAGVKANPLASTLGLPQGHAGRIPVGPDLQVAGHPGVFAIGDVAQIEGRKGRPLPQLAPVAMQSGRHAARQLDRLLTGRLTKRFRYVNKGTMATIGRRAAVAELPGRIRLHGTPAWFSWLGLHLVFLIGFRNRISVLVNWAWSYLTWDRGPRLIFSPIPEEGYPLPAESAEE